MKSIVSLARVLASRRGRAVSVAGAFDLLSDPETAFAIVPMRVVGEEVIQAVGFGAIDQSPNCAVEYHALSRRTQFLEEFGKALDLYLVESLADEGAPRIYLPHSAALEVLTILAARYETNREASAQVQRLGYLCRLIKEMSQFPGQQIVVIMTDTIRRHAVTGQNPAKDGHLGSLLTWLSPQAGQSTTEAADEMALLHPSAAMLHRPNDDLVESYLRDIKRFPGRAGRLRALIEEIQRQEVRAEWETLVAARRAFWNLNLNVNDHQLAVEIREENCEWLRYRLDNQFARARRAIPMTKLHEKFEYHRGIHDAAMIELDPVRFEQERAKGDAFIARIAAVRMTPRGTNPKDHQADIRIEDQPKLKLRVGKRIRAIGTPISGIVRGLVPVAGGYVVTMSVTGGVRSLPSANGLGFRWTGEVPKNSAVINHEIHRIVGARLAV